MNRFSLVIVSIVCGTSLCAQSAAPPPEVKPEDKCSIEGTVVSVTSGETLKKVHLTLRPIGQAGIPVGTVTDSAGHFLIDGVDPGRYSFFAQRTGFVPQTYSAQGSTRQNTTLTLTNGQKMTQIVFKLTPQGVITGHVVDQDGEPLARVQLTLQRFAYQRGRRQLTPGGGVITNDLGEYRMFDIRPGKYVLSAKYQSPDMNGGSSEVRFVGSEQAVRAAEEGYPTLYYPNAMSPESGSEIEITAGAHLQGIDMALYRIHTVHVKGHANVTIIGQRQSNIALMLMPKEAGFAIYMPSSMSRSLDAKGNFDIRGVAPGSYYLTGNYSNGNLSYSARVPVDVGNSNVENVEVNFLPRGEISGRVIVEDHGDLKGASLNVNMQPRLMQPMMGGTGGPVKEDLTFKFGNVGPDPYDINVYGLPGGFYLKSIRVGDEDITETGADFSRGIPAAEMTVVLNPNGGKIEGTVQNAKNENAVSAFVTLIPDEKHRTVEWLYKAANTDQNGHFTINGVRPGEYKIYAWEELEPGSYMDPDFMKPHESAGAAVSIKDSSNETLQLTVIPIDKK